ncbi:MAG: alpha-L-fucosidase [Bacteroidales bacterium]|nr:alpha-L-fucosidase [Bacteroidales bacterium]HPO65706.1 alpha-L-fucosidase [Bacteroidales bacterium]
MKALKIFAIVGIICLRLFPVFSQQVGQQRTFEPTFVSLEKVNPVPEWFKDAKFGIYLHWGVYSVPAYANEWYPRNMYVPGSNENKHHIEKYGDIAVWPYHNFILGAKDKEGNFVQFAPRLKSEGGNFDPDEWAQLFADAGVKFAGMVAEHHDGFSMWASKANPWNAKDLGPKLDLVELLSKAIRQRNLKLLLSMHHAYNITGYFEYVPPTNDPKLQILYGRQGKEKNEALWLDKHKEIIDGYQPDIIYQDFNLHRISEPILLGFLSYYYNQAQQWNKEVVATFKDGLNTKCGVLDYERGGPTALTDIYWLSDDAISATSWCYTEGLTYYSPKQLLHSLIDKVSKNGNLLLNISPKADGSIPQEQKDILLTIGKWLKKYGEAIYNTRAWQWYGEGPTKMGANHGVFIAPQEGTAKDIRYTRSKDNTTLYAILLGWERGQKEIKLSLLSTDHINLQNLKSVEMIMGAENKYQPLTYQQTNEGLIINLPDNYFEDAAYVIRMSFEGTIPPLDNYADINVTPHYYLIPANENSGLIVGRDLVLAKKRKDAANQWKLEAFGKGFYKIINRKDNQVLEYNAAIQGIGLAKNANKDNQLWKIETTYYGLLKITNKQFPGKVLSISGGINEGAKVITANASAASFTGWQLKEVCDLGQQPYKPHTVPGAIEAEDFDTGCPDEAFHDRNEVNEGGQYRMQEGVDIEKCSAGGFNVGWINRGEWLAYTVTVNKTATYQVSFYLAAAFEGGKFHLECDDKDVSGIIDVPSTGGFQNWTVVKKNVKLEAGKHILKFVADGDNFNIDKMVFEEIGK